MKNQLIIDASQADETRVAVLKNGRIEEFDFEAQARRSSVGNIYLGKVTRVEPSLQACFVDFGNERHGFLSFNDIHPDFYRIPKEDREALLASANGGNGGNGNTEARADTSSAPQDTTDNQLPDEHSAEQSPPPEHPSEPSEPLAEAEEPRIEQVGGGEDEAQGPARATRDRWMRRYKIQEVIKRNQVILVQIAKEERASKGAALTTYLSLVGRYCVLMPNSGRGGAISRKITQNHERQNLRGAIADLNLPSTMGLIVRTSAGDCTADEIRNDYDYLQNVWNGIRERTLNGRAPVLIHEDGHIIERTVRDLYKTDIPEILIEGQAGYDIAQKYMEVLMPQNLAALKLADTPHIFQERGVEAHLANLLQPVVPLQSGGYLVINQTEALVAVDVNSGKATREHSIEKTALTTNLEAATEVARQMRLRDLAGLIVIDFIDMMERRNNRAVERRLKQALKNDRARIQLGRISGFGLMEMSRQRLRSGFYQASSISCPHCHGSGQMRSAESRASLALRQLQPFATAQKERGAQAVALWVPADVADELLTKRKDALDEITEATSLKVEVRVGAAYEAAQFALSGATLSGATMSGQDSEEVRSAEPPPPQSLIGVAPETKSQTPRRGGSRSRRGRGGRSRRGRGREDSRGENSRSEGRYESRDDRMEHRDDDRRDEGRSEGSNEHRDTDNRDDERPNDIDSNESQYATEDVAE